MGQLSDRAGPNPRLLLCGPDGVQAIGPALLTQLKSAHGYFVLLGVMGTIVAGLVWLFRRKRWL
jgi:hypothetical protein